ncbi:hypothetical protein LINGRAHAP2_LOCUS7047 [Linum grandiflorum]
MFPTVTLCVLSRNPLIPSPSPPLHFSTAGISLWIPVTAPEPFLECYARSLSITQPVEL